MRPGRDLVRKDVAGLAILGPEPRQLVPTATLPSSSPAKTINDPPTTFTMSYLPHPIFVPDELPFEALIPPPHLWWMTTRGDASVWYSLSTTILHEGK